MTKPRLTTLKPRLGTLAPRLTSVSSNSWRAGKEGGTARGYGYKWQKARAKFLMENPLCVMCQSMVPPRVTAAEVVDHIVPHQGDQELFWNESNWQSLCKLHHDGEKAEIEGRHKARAKFDDDGRVLW